MAISDEDKERLTRLRESLLSNTFNPAIAAFEQLTEDIELTNIPIEDLKALVNPGFVVGVDFTSIDTSGSFFASDMNAIAPGALDIAELKTKFSNQSLTLGKVIDVVETQAGSVSVTTQIKDNNDIEDIVQSKTISQGVNLHLVNRGAAIDQESTADSEIQSKFVEE